MTRIVVVAVVALFLTGCASSGRSRGPTSLGEHQARQRENIREGAEEGDLTRKEAARLRERQRDVADERRDARQDDGRIGRGERREIKKDQKKLGRDIYEQRHDDDTR